jgi:hypothetical protein
VAYETAALRNFDPANVADGSKTEELELCKCLLLFTQQRTFGGATLPTANLAASRIFSNSLPIGTTRTPQKSSRSCRIMNVTSLFDRFGGR